MKIHHSHPWKLKPREAIQLQEDLRTQVEIRPLGEAQIRSVGGVDVGFPHGSGKAHSAVAVLEYPSMQLVDHATAELLTPFPYIPGLLSFREIPAILAALEKLNITPDVLITDGHGMAHPRRFGLACHLGVLLDLPTLGCAKSVFVGEHEMLPEVRGSTKPLVDGQETIGMAVRTRDKVKPVYVSTGQYIDLNSAVRLVLACGSGYRLPEPIRWADRLASRSGSSPTEGM
jgi:deoxyribonuclease V